jgi:FkbM family methyltransferase
MNPFTKILVSVVCRLSANRPAQSMLQRVVIYANYFMGIGSGAHAGSSGEAGVLRGLSRCGQSPLVVFDVGANQGQFLELAIRETDPSRTAIHCFEPAQAAFSALNHSYGDRPGVYLNNVALGETKKEATLYYDTPGSGLASLTKRRLDHLGIDHGLHESVAIDTIDAYCEARGIEAIDLLKIDVEGNELDVLRGATKMLANKAIHAVTFEFGGCNIDTRTFLQDYWYFFLDNGMRLFRVTPTGYLFPIHAYSEVMEQLVTTNFVASR